MNRSQAGFITLEGIEGAGKSTHQLFIRDLLINRGRAVITTREPGGTSLGEKLRGILLQKNSVSICAEAELLMMFAARQQHISEVILPALAAGKIVICDRFSDSSYAYQCGGRGIDDAKFDQLKQWVHPDLSPDMTLLFDLPPEEGLRRARSAGELDRFESETLAFFSAARDAYLRLATGEPDRFHVIDAGKSISDIQADITRIFSEAGLV